MARFIVTRREVWTSGVEIEAESQDEALNRVFEGEGEEVDGLLQYSHTLDSYDWEVEEVDELSDQDIDDLTKKALAKTKAESEKCKDDLRQSLILDLANDKTK